MFAIVEISGKQYKITPNCEIQVDLLEGKEGDMINIKEVLLLSDEKGKECKIGTPYLQTEIKGSIKEHVKGEKIVVFKKIAKKRHEKTQGHRQKYTIVKIGEF